MTRKGLYKQQTIPFPNKLMNTAESPSTLGLSYARNITNMIPADNKTNTGQKRYGLVQLGTAIGSGVIWELMEYVKDDGTIQILAYTNDGKIHLTEDFGATWTEERSGLNTSGTIRYDYLQRKLIIVNGFDDNLVWDGSSFSDMSQTVQENLTKEWVSQNSLTVSSPDDISSRYASGSTITLTYNVEDLEVSSITQTAGTATITTASAHGLVVGEKVVVRNALPEGYNGEFEILATPSTTTMEVSVDSGLSSPATIDQPAMSIVKGESIPVTEWQGVALTAEQFENSQPNLIISSDNPVTGVRGLIKKFPAGGVDRMDATIYKRKRGSTEWEEVVTISNVGGATKQPFNITNLEPAVWEFRFESGYAPRGTAVVELAYQTVIDGEIVANGNRYLKELVVSVSSITRSGNTATVTTSSGHGLALGDAVTVFNVEQEDYNGTFIVDSVTSDTVFTYEVANDPVSPATVDSSLVTTIVLDADNIEREPEVDSTSYSSGLQTVVFTTNPMPAAGTIEVANIDYTDKPPAFSFIYSKHDRLWALSGGELQATTYRDNGDDDRLTVFYTTERDVINSWIDATTQGVAFIDTRNKHGVEDEFVGISSISGSLVFHGRERLQIWLGTNPTDIDGFAWGKTVNIGTVHGDLIEELPNDVLFLSDYGFRSLSVAFQTEELEIGATIGEAIDPTAEAMARSLKSSDSVYKTAKSFAYKNSGLYGFKAGGTMIVYIITEKAKGWVFFNGGFTDSKAFLTLSDGRLLATKNDKLLRYANGVLGGNKEYNDDGNSYTTIWFTPWVELRRRWFNQWWQFITDNNEDTRQFTFSLYRYKDNNSASQSPINVTLGQDLALWDEALWDVDLWDSGSTRERVRDQFKAESFAFAIVSNNTDGGLNIAGVTALGA